MKHYHSKKKRTKLFETPTARLILRLLSVLGLFSISRWLIYPFNMEFFHHLTQWQALHLYFLGWRFDLMVIAFANIPLILYYCLPFKFIYNKVLQKIVEIYFVTINSVLILANMIDVVYFRFLGRRMTYGFLSSIKESSSEIIPVLEQVFVDYWFMIVLAVLLVLMLVVVSIRTRLKKESTIFNGPWYFQQWTTLLAFAILTPIACRGGVQKHPLSLASALQYADSQNTPIVLNTPFTIAKTTTTPTLDELHFYDAEEMSFSPIHLNTLANRFVSDSLDYQPNLVFLVLESFGQEMINYYNPDGRHPLTPFLDSLLEKSLTFNGRANGRRPIETLPAMLSGLPALMEMDYFSPPYLNNKVDGLGRHLKELGYHTSLFYGGFKGNMNTYRYGKKTGFNDYYGSDDYPNDTDYDGRLGIFDGPFLKFTLNRLNTLPQPFATLVITLSSRYPYTLPKDFELPPESYLWSGFEKTVYYSDYALRDFFLEASQQPWYDSTLFVITANHANTEHFQAEYSNVWGMYAVPIAFYMPSRITAQNTREMAQQTDLNLSILSALGVNDTVFSFGRNLFDSVSKPSFIAYINQTFQYSDGQYLVQSDGEHTIGVFNIIRDPRLEDNLIDRIQCADLAKMLREGLQVFNNRLINDQLYIDKQALYEQEKDSLYHQSDLGTDPQEEPTQSN